MMYIEKDLSGVLVVNLMRGAMNESKNRGNRRLIDDLHVSLLHARPRLINNTVLYECSLPPAGSKVPVVHTYTRTGSNSSFSKDDIQITASY